MSHTKSLPRLVLGTGGLFAVGLAASSPQTVLQGGIPATLAQTGVSGVPLSFALVMVFVGLLTVGGLAVGRSLPHGAMFYAQLARGLNPAAGLATAGVAIVGYAALQASLFPLIGATLADRTGGAWWMWAGAAWLLVALLVGRYPGRAYVRFLAVLLALEIAVILLFILAGFSHPASEPTWQVWQPSNLFVNGAAAAGVLVFAMAAHSGLETIPAYAEEAKSYRVVVLGWLAAIGTGGVLYAMMSWSYESWLGPDRLAQAGDPANSPVVLLHEVFGAGIADMALGLFVTSVLAAACSLGGTVARYTFAMARESVLPTWCGKTSRRDAPLGGSIVQAVLAGITLIVMTAAGMRPETIFTWLSTIGALCVLILLTASSWSALNFFKRGLGRGASNPVTQRILPFIGGICGLIGLGFTGSSLGGLLGAPPGSPLPWLVAVPIGGFALIGLLVGAWLKTARPQVYDLLGLGTPKPELVLDNDLANIRI